MKYCSRSSESLCQVEYSTPVSRSKQGISRMDCPEELVVANLEGDGSNSYICRKGYGGRLREVEVEETGMFATFSILEILSFSCHL